MKSKFGDGLATVLADSVAAVVHLLQCPTILIEQITGIVGERDLLLALERLGSGVGLVVACAVTGVLHQVLQFGLRRGDLLLEMSNVGLDLAA